MCQDILSYFLFQFFHSFILRYSRSTLNMDETYLLTSDKCYKRGHALFWDLLRAQNIYNDDAAKSTIFGLKRAETAITVNYVLVII